MGCGDEKLSKSLTQIFTAHCNAMICHQVTLSGDAEWPKVADAVIEARRRTCISITPKGHGPTNSRPSPRYVTPVIGRCTAIASISHPHRKPGVRKPARRVWREGWRKPQRAIAVWR